MRSAHFSILAGTAVALVLTAATTVSVSPVAAQPNPDGNLPSYRDVTASRPKPASQFGPSPLEGTTRSRAAMPTPAGVQPQRREMASPNMPAPAPAPILSNPEIKVAPIISGPGAPAAPAP